MNPQPSFGIPGVTVEPGQHLCALHFGAAQRDAILLPFLREGLHAGDKCLFAVHDERPDGMLTALRDQGGVDVSAVIESTQLDLCTALDQAMTGGFSVDNIIGYWDASVSGALAAGYPFVRLGAEAKWWNPQVPGLPEFFRYEAELRKFTRRYPQAVLCLYDLELYGENIVVELLKTHPQVLLGGVLLSNPYHLPPDEFIDG